VESGTFPLYAASGHLIFFRDGALSRRRSMQIVSQSLDRLCE
jgi:hypothetical protein